MLSTLFGKICDKFSLFLYQCGSYYKLSSWWKHSTEAAKSEWSKRFVSRHVVFGSLWGIGLYHLQNIIATHMVDELDLLCVELGFRWTIQGSKNWVVRPFFPHHLVFGSLKSIGLLCHLQKSIATHLVDELGLTCVELVFWWTMKGSKKWVVQGICFPSCSFWQPLRHRHLSSAKYYRYYPISVVAC